MARCRCPFSIRAAPAISERDLHPVPSGYPYGRLESHRGRSSPWRNSITMNSRPSCSQIEHADDVLVLDVAGERASWRNRALASGSRDGSTDKISPPQGGRSRCRARDRPATCLRPGTRSIRICRRSPEAAFSKSSGLRKARRRPAPSTRPSRVRRGSSSRPAIAAARANCARIRAGRRDL